jgi:rhamnulokinase
LEEIHRFKNPGVQVLGSLHWDPLRLFDEMKQGLRIAAGRDPVSLGVDTWGVDFALLDRNGKLIGNPYHYRDGRTHGMLRRVLDIVSREEIFEHTGLQFMEINTLFQLFSMKGSPALDAAHAFLMMPDLFHYWFTGRQTCEFTDATTTQFFDPRKNTWAVDLLRKLGLPTDIFPDTIPPGTTVGDLHTGVAEECGVRAMSVIAPACHDTGSAVAAVPAESGPWAFLSSGTWSLLGVEVPRPYVTPAVLEKNFTNEGGVWGTTRLLKNICGMWLLEECRREWARQGIQTSYAQLCAQAEAERPFRSLINVDDPVFVAPGSMPQRLAEYCRATGQAAPETPGQFARVIFECLALKYRLVLDDLAAITGEPAKTLHIVGGGSQNEVVCRFASDATGIPVVAGPAEATALGNVLLQAMALGRIADSTEARQLVRQSFEPKLYEPRGASEAWQQAAGRLLEIIARRANN